MRATNMKKAIVKTQMLLAAMVALAMLLTVSAHAAAPGIKGASLQPGRKAGLS